MIASVLTKDKNMNVPIFTKKYSKTKSLLIKEKQKKTKVRIIEIIIRTF